jgi:hypothetical protein
MMGVDGAWDAAKQPPHEAVRRVNRVAMLRSTACVTLRNLMHRAFCWRLKFAVKFSVDGGAC